MKTMRCSCRTITLFIHSIYICSLLLLVPKAVTCNDQTTQIQNNNIRQRQLQKAADHVSMTKEAADLRSKHVLRKKPILKQSVSTTSLLFPGAEPIEYTKITTAATQEDIIDNGNGNHIPMFVEYVESRKTPVGVDYSELPVCPTDTFKMKRKNLGQRLMGHSTKQLGYEITPIQQQSCTILCHITMNAKQLKLMRKLIQKQYRAHYTLDSLPIIVRSHDLNHALRGYPMGFQMNSEAGEGGKNEIYLNNHLRFTIYYNDFSGAKNHDKFHITGFDVLPVSIQHVPPANGWVAGFKNNEDKNGATMRSMPLLSTCNADSSPVQNKRDSFLALKTDAAGEDLHVVYSYEVEWKQSEVEVRLIKTLLSFQG